MAGSYSGAGIAVEIFVKQNQVTPVWVGLELFEITEHRSAPSLILEKYVRHATRQFSRYFPQGHHLSRSGWELDFEVVAQVVMKLLKRFNEQVVHREPNGATPVGVAAEQSGRRLA